MRHLRLSIAVLVALPMAAAAQDFSTMIQQQMNAMNQNIARGQQQVNQIVQQRMHAPQLQAAYRPYVARSGGRPAMDYPTFTYNDFTTTANLRVAFSGFGANAVTYYSCFVRTSNGGTRNCTAIGTGTYAIQTLRTTPPSAARVMTFNNLPAANALFGALGIAAIVP
jgi:hypothetical protein